MDMQQSGGAVEIDIGGWLGDIFKHMSARWQQYLKPFGAVFVGVFGMVIVLGCAGAIASMGAGAIGGDAGQVIGLGVTAIMGLVGLVFALAMAPIGLGMCRGTQAALRGQEFTLDHITGSFKDFLPAVGVLFLSYVAIVIGSILCLIPGIIAGILLSMSMPVLADRGGSPIDAMKGSVDLVKPNAVMFFVFMLVLGVVNFALNLIPILGALVGALMQLVAINFVYLKFSGQAGSMGEDGIVRRAGY